ncbi:C2HC5 finger protein [Trichophyton equinum CBS 127.97]|uniref:C2HC5 finger protein n=1 Tax=Trichophyton equinum (strain ATCC MYA-4606 / CBS 127.97) TaxID=559882 RepID=F2PX35_TRIEC|nr:C2HC5 finger protein [Trichophyton equinum CBS 127.97]
MSGSSLESWAVPRLARLLPLDEESLKQVISYSSSLSKDESAVHLRNLLDDSPAALEFISAFNSRRGQSGQQSSNSSNGSGGRSGQIPEKQAGTKSQRGALKPPPTARQPEGYGDTSGGYTKPQREENYMASSAAVARGAPESISSGSSSRNPSPASTQSKSRLPPSATGPMISEYLPNVRSKKVPKNFGQHNAAPSSSSNNTAQKKTGRTATSTNATTTTTTTNNIADITSAIAALEILTSNPSKTQTRKLKKGKLVKTYEKAEQPREEDTGADANAEEAVEDTTESPGLSVGEGTFSNNPLLKGAGLVRPTWKPSGEGSDKPPVRRREQKQTWRRVQDDNDDNEQWILDGGLHGYDRESEPAQCG